MSTKLPASKCSRRDLHAHARRQRALRPPCLLIPSTGAKMSREPDSHRHALRQRVLSAPCLLFHPSREIGRPDEQRARISALRGRQSTLTYRAMVPEARFALACLAAAVSETAMYPFHHSGKLVRMVGLAPTRPFGHNVLNVACLLIPPHPRKRGFLRLSTPTRALRLERASHRVASVAHHRGCRCVYRCVTRSRDGRLSGESGASRGMCALLSALPRRRIALLCLASKMGVPTGFAPVSRGV